MQLGELIQRTLSLYNRGLQTKDSRLTDLHVYSALKTGRATLLRQMSNKHQYIPETCYQDLECIELEKSQPFPSMVTPGCVTLQSKLKLPAAISDLEDTLINYVTTLDGSTKFDKGVFKNEKYSKGNKFTGTKPGFYLKRGHLVITVLKQLKAVTANILAADPLEVLMFPSFCNPDNNCECIDIMKWEFPMEESMIKPMLDIAAQELVVMMAQMSEDKKGNSTEDTAPKFVHQPQQEAQ